METTGRQRTGEPGSVEAIPGPAPDDLTLRLRGVLDAAAVRRLEGEIRRIVAPGHPGALVVDLSAAEYCDGGMLVLVDAVRLGTRGRFAVQGPDPEVLGTADSAGLREVFAAYRASVALARTVPQPVVEGRCTAEAARLARACADLAVAVPTAAGEVDVSLVAGRLADRSAQWFGLDAAVLVTVAGVVAVAASAESARVLTADGGEGPVTGCLRTGRRVAVPDLTTLASTWPSFVPRALRHGVRSVHAVPLRPPADPRTVGVLVLFARDAGPMAATDLDVAAAFADLTATALSAARPAAPGIPPGSPTSAAADRVLVEQASGVLAERHGIDLAEARALLVRSAGNRDLHLGEVARLVVSGEVDVEGR
ncbi:ANTAR domain-containing protein [Pseudonocardia saturnea]